MNASKENRIAVVMEKHLEKATDELSGSDEFVDCWIPPAIERRLAVMCASVIAAMEESQDLMRESEGS